MADFIPVPLKKPSEVDLVKPLKNLIQSRYSTSDKPEDYSEAINEFSKLRNNAIWRVFEKFESSLEVAYSYYDQLVAFENKIPPQEVQIPFKWKDAFDKGSIFGSRISLTVASMSYEKICILFNIGALQSAIATSQSLENDDGLKLAAKLLQQSSGIYSHLKNTVMLAIQQDPTPDLHPDTLGALSALMLAQAQEMFVHKAIHDSMKDSIVAKLACQCEDLYAEAHKLMNKDHIKQLWEKDWINLIHAKTAAMKAISEYYQSLVCKSSKAVGAEIAWLEHAQEMFKQVNMRHSTTMYNEIMSKAQRNLNEAKKDNDFIYHERIPDVKSLDPIGKAQPAKVLPIPVPMSQNFKDLFTDLVPVAVHQAMAAYDVRKTEIVNGEITRLRDSTQILNGLLASLNLPAAIEITDGSSLPASICEKADKVKSMGGIQALQTLMSDLPELLKRNQDILDECQRMLNEEKEADDTLKKQFKERWNRTPSEKLTEMFRGNLAKYQEIINNAKTADKTVKEKFEVHSSSFELLSRGSGALQSAVPAGNGSNLSNSSTVTTLRALMEEVETIKAERDVIESELKNTTFDMKGTFMHSLAKDGAISEANLSVESLGKTYGALQKQVKESVQKQDELVPKIQSGHVAFMQERGATSGGRDSMMMQLAAAHDAFCDLENNLKEGTKFYNDLTQLLVVFQNKISDYCFARKTEKEELMKDLTQESSRAIPNITPSQPAYHKEPDNKPTPQPAAPQAPGAPSSSQQPFQPYPQYCQMPMPYGATTATPYPTYMPPQMPQGYNPYASTMPPYPQQYNTYPGSFPPFPQHTGGYQPPPPGSGYPHQQPPQGW